MNEEQIQSIVPDWSEIKTVAQMEQQIQPDGKNFKFIGPGWYYYEDGTTIVIVPIDRPLDHIAHQRSVLPEERFRVYIYTKRNPGDTLCKLLYLPTRKEVFRETTGELAQKTIGELAQLEDLPDKCNECGETREDWYDERCVGDRCSRLEREYRTGRRT